ncbi:uncharacterized protein LOC100840073 [Brachypodium distachyon]|uniref:HIT-type domain-containing protein n=1 Tax=Brachypodium distachyon TaxID=15368 RepID=I1J3D0_BRADI|nr:uncharacterized protein LOC100840073 [Brachypodium distachyon]PNT62141.1 hypothetical protein BRADI_5g26180v3 [Brachypodium distachyon]|eukprot:XP_014751273.1 uncharacterized protein LOC100840073 [Brachypodium distachyon]
MSRSSVPAAVLLLLVALAAAMATAAAAIEPQDDEHPLLHEEPQDNKRALLLDELVEAARAQQQQLMPQIKEEPAAQMAWAEALTAVQTAEKKDGGARASLPAGTKPAMAAAISIQGGDPGSVPAASGGNGKESGEHGKEEGNGGSSKEGEKSASASAGAGKSCLSKEECHKKRLLCGKGCTLSAHAKCAAKCSKSCVPTC